MGTTNDGVTETTKAEHEQQEHKENAKEKVVLQTTSSSNSKGDEKSQKNAETRKQYRLKLKHVIEMRKGPIPSTRN